MKGNNTNKIEKKNEKQKEKKISNSFGGIYENLEINIGKNDNNAINYEDLPKVVDQYLKRGNENSEDKLKSLKYFTFIDFLKSIIVKRSKGNHYFISIFRKHLLSEEHLLKSHIKMVFMEKQHNFHGEENTNILECFNEL